MKNTTLTLDEINLLLYSEEPKNTELYGNLYDVLSDLHPTKAICVEQNKSFDPKSLSALTYNKKLLIDTVIHEWYAERVTEEDPNKKIRCGLCNTPNKYLYYIRNRKNGNILNVGSSCITKFPGIEGYIEQKQQLSHILKNQKMVSRRNEFHKHFPNVNDFISECEKYKQSIPIALPYALQEDLDNTIIRLRKIYNTYIDSGKKPFKSIMNSFELFQTNINHYNKIKLEIDKFIETNINHPHICKKQEMLWLIENDKLSILKTIQNNNGFYTKTTSAMICSNKFIRDNFPIFLKHCKTKYVKICELKPNSYHIFITFQKDGYDYPITGKITLQKFMNNIGANCLFVKNFCYQDKTLLTISTIDPSIKNIQSILNYIFNFMESLHCVFLIDYDKKMLVLYRKSDKAIRYFKFHQFINWYFPYFLKSDEAIFIFLKNMINNTNVRWTLLDEQKKYNVDNTIGKMFDEQYLSLF